MSGPTHQVKQRGRIHITAVGGSAAGVVAKLGVKDAKGLVELARSRIGNRFRVTANARMIFAKETPNKGGRSDDAARVREIETLLADDNVAALVTIRGGAWFTRILDRIDFDVLERRRTTIHIFGFSEMTPIIAIAGQYAKAVGLYDLGPGFLYNGMKRYARKNIRKLAGKRSQQMSTKTQEAYADGWAAANYPPAFAAFFNEVADILDGRGSTRVPTGRLLAGRLPASKKISITGGNLNLILPMVGSPFASAIETQGKWLAIEDVNLDVDNLDRLLAGLKLNGLLARAEGIILGDFHNGDTELSQAVFNMLKYHLSVRRIPIVALDNFGHIWPIAPLPMHREVTLCCHKSNRDKPRVTIQIPWNEWSL